MKTKTVKRYYCDFCKKAGQSLGHMRKHENHCTANPNRECGMCALMQRANGDTIQRPMSELLAALDNGGLDELRRVADGCPACMLAAMVQERQGQRERGEEETWYEFDYKKERDALFGVINPLLDGQNPW